MESKEYWNSVSNTKEFTTPFQIVSGYINPTIELIQVAWYWSGGDIENIDYNKFEKVINSYKQNYKGNIDKNIDILINADIYGGLAWINYNLKRSLCIENNYDKEEIELAENEVIQSLNEIKYNVSQFEKMTEILKSKRLHNVKLKQPVHRIFR